MKFLKKAAVILLALLLALLGISMAFLYSPLFRFPVDAELPPPRIGRLIWPTIGYPALVPPGGELEVEVNLRPGGEPPGEEVGGWEAVIQPARPELAASCFRLQEVEARRGFSQRWPELAEEGGEEVWHVRFRIPAEAFPELYDLRVALAWGGERLEDGQPHSLAVTGEEDGDLTFVVLTDVHVHLRGNSAPFSRQSDKGVGPEGEPIFFQEALEQVNLLRPDFVLMLGDYVRGQRRPGDLLAECELFYRALLELEVPAFLVPGNHDQYVNGIDGARWYRENIGPTYYSFDLEGCHFTCLNTYQWPFDDRVVMNKLVFMEPRKWQGQVLGADDPGDPATYRGQLAWAEGDLAAHQGARLRLVALHHDPYTADGRGFSYVNPNHFGIFRFGGGGEGREALLSLAARHHVDMVLGGHLHVDRVGRVPWEDGKGETVYSCQSCLYFQGGGWEDSYPGYRLVEVEDGEITGFSYLDGVSSYPFYDGCHPGGATYLDGLETPAIGAEVLEPPGEEGRVSLRVKNYLGKEMEIRGLVVTLPASPSGDYRVEGAEVYRRIEPAGLPGRVVLYLRTTLEKGMPGGSGTSPGVPGIRLVTVSARGI